MQVTMIGHSSVLIEVAGLTILTDPFFRRRGNLAYRRLRPPAVDPTIFTNVDIVLISHNHWDHIDRVFLRTLSDRVPVLAPASRAWLTRLKGARSVVGLRPWKDWRHQSLRIVATPARHIAVTIGFVVEAEERRIYFAGDTYFGTFMERIAKEYHPDVALMPVTTFRIPMTMGEAAAEEAVRILSPSVVIPIHLGIAPRSPLLRTRQSAEGFRRRIEARELPASVVILSEGETWSDR